MKEFAKLTPDAKIYKAHGPILLNQSLSEASDLVSKRLEFIRGEIDRVENLLKELQGKAQRIQNDIVTLSNQPVREKE